MKSWILRSSQSHEVLGSAKSLVLIWGMLGLVALYIGGPVLVHRGPILVYQVSNPHVSGVDPMVSGL